MMALPPILLVEDDVSLAEAVIRSLEESGVPVEHCLSAEVAVDLLRAQPFALVVLDLVLGHGASGLYVVDALRNVPDAERPLVVLMTGASLNLRAINRQIVRAVIFKPLDFALTAQYILTTYRRALELKPIATAEKSAMVRTFCGSCASEIAPWLEVKPVLLDIARHESELQRWAATPCTTCGARPDEGAHTVWNG